MGQFASTAFDGDPYIDIMRALPDKELTWWIQKGLWLAEGFTFAEHFGRTYKTIFMHQCEHCNGAGTVTCPHCHGYKVKRAHTHAFRLQDQSGIGRILAKADMQECDHCGGHCEWDAESDWQEKWNDWDSKLSYYDRTYAPLMDEWHEEVINEGHMDEDTQPPEEPVHPEDDHSQFAQISREITKDEQRTKALMRRMGGHPYDRTDMIPNKVLDPSKPVAENLDALGYNHLDLPPELRPESFPGLLLQGADSPLFKFDNEVRMEYVIMRNLDAAIKGQPKPGSFAPTAGTVECPACRSEAWCYNWTPNLGTLLRHEQPFWSQTLARMAPYWDKYSMRETSPNFSPWVAAASASGRASGDGRANEEGTNRNAQEAWQEWRARGEAPIQPLVQVAGQDKSETGVRSRHVPPLPAHLRPLAGCSKPEDTPDYGMLVSNLMRAQPDAPAWLKDYGKQMLPPSYEAALSSGDEPDSEAYGPRDPLSKDPLVALDSDDLEQVLAQSNTPGAPLQQPGQVLRSEWQATEAINAARRRARAIRDARQLGKAETPEEQELMLKWAAVTLKLAAA
eukprot:CAMPEP_0202351510 /NCGR_PEP_ID=MMETSP1126-20121109/8116_1 /ASSEMBLY_ACC=CAM_ASM_000457 /TAXON_ID=3047 /ORGANISM="Dunaliella tertiolecta, Strain CCMP1320" /LENGTH=564 /DNA_ID=CAMNT_0048943621 /DNA_START=107 /DNA_END=1800 /DNA_ORIENTATION=+